MADLETGQRVEADISATMPELGVTVITHGMITGPGSVPGTFVVQTDAAFNGNDVFQLEADCLRIGPSTIPSPRHDPPMADLNRMAYRLVKEVTEPRQNPSQARVNGRNGSLNGAKARAEKLTERRAEIARLAAQARWRASE
jgi:hypothetical protein